MADMPNAITPENIAAVAQNADKILAAILGQSPAQPEAPVAVEAPAQAPQKRRHKKDRNEVECCCPRKVKFFIFGNTWINNYNAACPLVPQ
jgi:hypothetical protein